MLKDFLFHIQGDLALHGHHVRAWDADIARLNELRERLAVDKEEAKDDGLLLSDDFLVLPLMNLSP